MIEIWQEYINFYTIILRLGDQVRKIIKKVWFSGIEILEIHQKTNIEDDNNTISDTPIIDKQEQSNRNEPSTSELQTPHNQTTLNKTPQSKHKHKNNNKFRKFKVNY